VCVPFRPTRERLPLQWARTQDNIGAALCEKAGKLGSRATAEEAITAIEAALEVFHHPDLKWYRANAERRLAHALALRERIRADAEVASQGS
jgi:hypothetical protein